MYYLYHLIGSFVSQGHRAGAVRTSYGHGTSAVRTPCGRFMNPRVSYELLVSSVRYSCEVRYNILCFYPPKDRTELAVCDQKPRSPYELL